MARPVYLDCDTGVDDAQAIAYLLAAQDAGLIELVGIGTVAGNTSAAQGARNTLDLLGLVEASTARDGRPPRPTVPVAVGAAKPLARDWEGGTPHIHGRNGVGNVALPRSPLEPVDETAAELLLWLSHDYAGALEIITIGPLTNVALALEADAELVERVACVTVMGGAALAPGNRTPVAEANIENDADAAAAVIAAGWPVTLVPLDITLEHSLVERDRQALLDSDRPVAQALGHVLDLYFAFYEDLYGHRGCALHDPLAAAIAVGEIVPTKAPRVPVVVDATDGPGRGQTICDLRGQRRGVRHHPDATVAVVLDTDRPLAPLLLERILSL